jgi:hypothetical protein
MKSGIGGLPKLGGGGKKKKNSEKMGGDLGRRVEKRFMPKKLVRKGSQISKNSSSHLNITPTEALTSVQKKNEDPIPFELKKTPSKELTASYIKKYKMLRQRGEDKNQKMVMKRGKSVGVLRGGKRAGKLKSGLSLT